MEQENNGKDKWRNGTYETKRMWTRRPVEDKIGMDGRGKEEESA